MLAQGLNQRQHKWLRGSQPSRACPPASILGWALTHPVSWGCSGPSAAPRGTGAHGEASTRLSHLANSLPWPWANRTPQKTPTQPSYWPASPSSLHSGLSSIPQWAEPSGDAEEHHPSARVFCFQNLRAHFGRFAAP